MSIDKYILKGASWLALFKFISQIFSWVITIFVARILVPGDYGLMEMSTIITGYIFIFNELGLGAAIIQKPNINQNELSSIFWLSMAFSSVLAVACYFIAYPTAYFFHEPRVIPITKTVSVVFLLAGLQIVPLNLLKKELRFKTIGIIEMSGTVISCIAMLIIASLGGGVWTLLGGSIIKIIVSLILTLLIVKWFPRFHFNLQEARAYLRFGLSVAIGQSLFYAYSKSDKLFAGRIWDSKLLGYYSFALQLAQIPTEKIVVLINQVSFPAFSKLQNDQDQFNRLYLNIMNITSTIVLPLFVGAFLIGDDIIRTFLNEKWYPMIFVFKFLCLSQIMTALNAVNNFVHTSQGRPGLSLYFNAVLAIFMPISFFLSVRYGLNAVLIPWFTTYFVICLAWIILTIRKIGIPLENYMNNMVHPIVATLLMSIAVIVSEYVIDTFLLAIPLVSLILKMGLGGTVYLSYLWFFQRRIFNSLKGLRYA